jgi:hypothetical protein
MAVADALSRTFENPQATGSEPSTPCDQEELFLTQEDSQAPAMAENGTEDASSRAYAGLSLADPAWFSAIKAGYAGDPDLRRAVDILSRQDSRPLSKTDQAAISRLSLNGLPGDA